MTDKMVGKWKMESSENFDEYMKTLGVGFMMRKMGNTLVPTVEITEADGEYELKTVTTFKTTVIKFKLDVPFEEETADGRKVQATMTMDGNTLVHEQKGNKEKEEKDSVLKRTFDGDTMTLTCTVDDVTATRVYKRTP
ncbi:sodium/calcium exchanger regulatory protein 1-like [Pollicipes pollicipes]|uniref:sodium/calcium exchanger regulatory protein 1-like n=1 Tax=Pollicipes pollicipes TaxID=41117 RepID=UPI001884D3B9|nr:sodium/calcium exchanger regulatory protein 1-like [Pollicipes pollicipes]